ncbi:hypothetical protein BH24ACT22_BH24ACT22_12340 [soil metagenome]
MEALVTGPESQKALPVFSFPEEAELFLHFEVSDGEWQVIETKPDKLLTLISTSHASIKSVALDPLPNMVAGATLALVSVSRRQFAERLTQGARRTLSSV